MAAVMSDEELHELIATLQRHSHISPTTRGHAIEWIEQTLRVREAQRTKSRTPAHEEMMEALRAATAQWLHEREQATNGYAAEMFEWERTHPRPTLREFMVKHRHVRTEVCPACGTEFEVEP